MKNEDAINEIFSNGFMKEAQWRGFIYQGTNNALLDKALQEERTPFPFYIGFDATADSLHVGNLMGIMFARVAQRNGLKPIILMGGGTTKVGDPSGKTESRQLLDDAVIQKNIEMIKKCFDRFLIFSKEPTGAIIVNNDDWLKDINYIDFLRDYGKYFSINRMLSMESVKLRLDREQPLTFLEFNYMILQAYDFYWLNKHYKCRLQLAGSDQWGNIVNGTDLTRRLSGKEVFGLTAPLIMTSGGEKMGKTHKGAIWLNADKLSSYDYWQFWRNCHDKDVVRFMKIYTDLSCEKIVQFEKAQGEELNEGKILLANEATLMLHGEEAVKSAQETALKIFVTHVETKSIEIIGFTDKGIPKTTTDLPAALAIEGMLLVEGLCALGMTRSKGEGRRIIKGKGIRLNDQVVENENKKLFKEDFSDNGLLKLSAGKKRHGLLYFKEEINGQ